MKNDNLNLFSQEHNLKIAKIESLDVLKKTDKFNLFYDLIRQHEEMYPTIDKWFKNKVIDGIKTKERIAYIGLDNNIPIVSAVVKRGNSSKFCHLHISKEYQDNNLGELYFIMMALETRDFAKEVYFTLPESLWTVKNSFFKSFGFNEAVEFKDQYRLFEKELISKVKFNILWKNVLDKLPRIMTKFNSDNKDIFNGLIMSIKPEYVNKIKSGEKHIEIRKKFNPKWVNSKVTIYSTSPSKAIYGYATIDKIEKGSPLNIWIKYSNKIGCSAKEFKDYTYGAKDIYAIILKDYKSYLSPLILNQIHYLLNKKINPPQSYSSLQNSDDWLKAVSIAELLHRRFDFTIQI